MELSVSSWTEMIQDWDNGKDECFIFLYLRFTCGQFAGVMLLALLDYPAVNWVGFVTVRPMWLVVAAMPVPQWRLALDLKAANVRNPNQRGNTAFRFLSERLTVDSQWILTFLQDVIVTPMALCQSCAIRSAVSVHAVQRLRVSAANAVRWDSGDSLHVDRVNVMGYQRCVMNLPDTVWTAGSTLLDPAVKG